MPGKRLLFCLIIISLLFAACRKNTPIEPEAIPISDTVPDKNNPPVVIPPAITILSIANVLQNDMVIQRDKPFSIWGTAPVGHTVNIAVSWNSGTFTAVADADGNWKASIPAAAANNNPQTINCSSAGLTAITLTDILIGDVWLCSGQSNMAMPVGVLAPSFAGVLNYQTEIAAANYPTIRCQNIQPDYAVTPQTKLNLTANWMVCSPQNAGGFSAVAYYFARKIQTTLNVPVGIIVAAINGSNCYQWMNHDVLKYSPEIAAYMVDGDSSPFNAMIAPLFNLQLKGFLWYQGENDQHLNPVSDYTNLNSALVKYWRVVFNQPDLPFYLVQLTPFADDYNATIPPGGDITLNWLGYFREAQANVLKVANTGMAITMDVGDAANHHPANKKPVGERLALLALKNTYGQNVICDGPKYSSYTINGNTAVINFTGTTADGLTTANNQPLNQLFFVAGADQIFKQATAQITGSTITITAPANFTLPIQAIRYAFTNSAITNIQNGAGLPMQPFRTDNWTN